MGKTDGINIQAMFQYENILDIRKLAVNNIHDMARMYGIEAANKTIVSEITGVFKVYGIEVDPRHLKLIADFMTFDGVYKPFNRVGMENNSSPLCGAGETLQGRHWLFHIDAKTIDYGCDGLYIGCKVMVS